MNTHDTNVTTKIIGIAVATIMAISVGNAAINAGRDITANSGANTTTSICASAQKLASGDACTLINK